MFRCQLLIPLLSLFLFSSLAEARQPYLAEGGIIGKWSTSLGEFSIVYSDRTLIGTSASNPIRIIVGSDYANIPLSLFGYLTGLESDPQCAVERDGTRNWAKFGLTLDPDARTFSGYIDPCDQQPNSVRWTGTRIPTRPHHTQCSGLELTSSKTSMAIGETTDLSVFGDTGVNINLAFTPAGCGLSVLNDKEAIEIGSSDDQVISIDDPLRYNNDSGSVILRAKDVGIASIDAKYMGVLSSISFSVVDRPPCISFKFDVSPSLRLGTQGIVIFPKVNEFGIETFDQGRLQPSGCSVGRNPVRELTMDRPELVEVNDFRVTGLAPGRVSFTARLGDISETRVLTIDEPRACERLTLEYPQREVAVGAVNGAAYDSPPLLTYRMFLDYRDGEVCKRPDGQPVFAAATPNISVDASSGAATGLSPGRARVGVQHGDLFAFYIFDVVDTIKTPCAELQLTPSKLELALTERTIIDATYRPDGCHRPVGLASYSVDVPGVVAVDPKGQATAYGPGTAEITMIHATLTSTVSITVPNLQPCTEMTAAFDRPTISPDRVAKLSVAYGPLPCSPPTGAPTVGLSDRLYLTATFEREWLVRVNNDDASYPGGTARVEHGNLTAVAELAGSFQGCAILAVKVVPSEFKAGEDARIELITDDPDCAPGRDRLKLSVPGIGHISEVGTELILTGKHGGVAEVLMAGPGVWGPRAGFTVIGPSCTDMTLEYYPNPIERGQMAPAELSFFPNGCTRTREYLEFSSDAPTVAMPETRAYLDDVGTLQARGWRQEKTQTATISVRYGSLSASTVVTVLRDRQVSGCTEGEPDPALIDMERVTGLDVINLDWLDYGYSLSSNALYSCSCYNGWTVVSVEGTDRYSEASHVCHAATHAGVITWANGGFFRVKTFERDSAFQLVGSTRNGIASGEYGSSRPTFSFVAVLP